MTQRLPGAGPPVRPAPRILPDLPWMVALSVAAFLLLARSMGTSPTIWEDTLIENLCVDDCIAHSRCTAVGVGATVGIFHSAGYLHWRALLYALGLYANGTFRTLLGLNALGVALVGLTARRLGGLAAGGIAAVVVVAGLGIPTQLNVITDVAPLPFLGAVFVLLGTAVVARPDIRMTALLGVVAGVMVNVYATGGLAGVSAVWIALLIPHRRWTHAAVAAGAFAGSMFSLSPMTWIVDLGIVLRSHHMGNGGLIVRHFLSDLPMTRLAAVATLAWIVAGLARSPLRRALDVPAAVILPLFIPFALGTWTNRLDPQDKYFAHVIAAVAVALAVTFTDLAGRLWRFTTTRPARLAEGSLGAMVFGWTAPILAVRAIVWGAVRSRSHLTVHPPDQNIVGGDPRHTLGHQVYNLAIELNSRNSDHRVRVLFAAYSVGVVLLAVGARRFVSRAAGGLATVLLAAVIALSTMQYVHYQEIPWTVSVAPCLGVILVLIALAGARQPRVETTAVLGLGAGVLAGLQPPAMLCGLSVVALGWLQPQRRGVHAAVAAVTFIAAFWLCIPPGWNVTYHELFHHVWMHGPARGTRALSDPTVALTVAATAAWVIAALRWPAIRREMDPAAMIFLPLAPVLALSAARGGLNPLDTLCAHALAAGSLGLAVAFTRGVEVTQHWVATGGLRPLKRPDRLWRVLDRVWGPASYGMPYLAAGLILVDPGGEHSRVRDTMVHYRTFTYDDVRTVMRVLGGRRHWSWQQAAVNLKVTDETTRRAAMRWPRGWPDHGTVNPYERAYLVKIPTVMVPRPLPENLLVTSSVRGDTTLLAFGCSWIDWRHFQVCVRQDGQTTDVCQETGLPVEADGHMDYQVGVPGFPITSPSHLGRQTLSARFPLTPTAQCPVEWVYMPRFTQLCPGRIVSVDGSTAAIEQEGRVARLQASTAEMHTATPTHELVVAWELGGTQCWNEYRGYPPFFVEGDPLTVSQLTRTLNQDYLPPVRSLW